MRRYESYRQPFIDCATRKLEWLYDILRHSSGKRGHIIRACPVWKFRGHGSQKSLRLLFFVSTHCASGYSHLTIPIAMLWLDGVCVCKRTHMMPSKSPEPTPVTRGSCSRRFSLYSVAHPARLSFFRCACAARLGYSKSSSLFPDVALTNSLGQANLG